MAKLKQGRGETRGEWSITYANDAARGHSAELYQDKAKRTVIEGLEK